MFLRFIMFYCISDLVKTCTELWSSPLINVFVHPNLISKVVHVGVVPREMQL